MGAVRKGLVRSGRGPEGVRSIWAFEGGAGLVWTYTKIIKVTTVAR